MSNSSVLIRSLVIYGICLPLAIGIGYMLSTPMSYASFSSVLLVLGLLLIPILLRWHYPWLVAAWNLNAVVFVLPGRPTVGLTMIAVSMMFSLLQHTLNKNYKFVHVPAIAWPLIFLTTVVLVTARLTGGIGLAMTGGSSVGGKRYMFLIGAVIGYFALAAHRIPPQRVALYVAMYFLSALTAVVVNLAGLLGPAFSFIYLLFPIDSAGMMALDPEAYVGPEGGGVERLGGLSVATTSIALTLLAFYGIRGVFDFRKAWRPVLFLLACAATMYGGFRGNLVTLMLIFSLVFWFEGLMRSHFLPVFLVIGLLCAAVVLPFATKLPISVQRTISFLPLVKVDPIAELDAQASTEWRLEMWRSVWPQVPEHLVLGKGLSIDPEELRGFTDRISKENYAGESLALAGDYHNGPLSVVLPFGIAGVIGFLWFLWAGIRVLHDNYRYGNPSYKRINTFLLAQFIAKAIFFMGVFGSFYGDLVGFTGLLGLSVAINHGRARRPAPVTNPAREKLRLPHAAAFARAAR